MASRLVAWFFECFGGKRQGRHGRVGTKVRFVNKRGPWTNLGPVAPSPGSSGAVLPALEQVRQEQPGDVGPAAAPMVA